MRDGDIEITEMRFEGRTGLVVKAGRRGTTRVVPPAGEEHSFDIEEWARRVEVWISPQGRSVRVWVDGTEVKKG